MSRFISLVQSKCPKCEKGDVFSESGNIFLFRLPKMHKTCSSCQHNFEVEPGFFIGAMYVSYALAVAEMVGTYLIVQFFIENLMLRIGILALVLVLLRHFNYRYARVIWMYMFTSKQ